MSAPKTRKPFTRLEVMLVAGIACAILASGVIAWRAFDGIGATKAKRTRAAIPLKAPAATKTRAADYLPERFRHVPLGTELAAYRKAEPDTECRLVDGIRWEGTLKNPADGISEATCYFELVPPHGYYELLLTYSSEADREAAAAGLGPPNFGDEWLVAMEDGTALLMWKAWNDKLAFQWLPKGASSAHLVRATPEQLREMMLLLEQVKESAKAAGQYHESP